MYHLLHRDYRPRLRPRPTAEEIGKWVRNSIYRGLICSACGNLTDERDCFCGQCGHYLNSVVDEAIADAIASFNRLERNRKAKLLAHE